MPPTSAAGSPDPEPAAAQSRPGADLLAEGRRRYEAGDEADAEPLARRALELRPPASDPAARSEALQLAAEVSYGRGRYAEARSLADEAAALRLDASAIDRAETENLQGIIDLSLGDHERGLERVRDGYALREAALGPDDPDTLESLNNTGVALGRVGRMDEAIAAHEEALRRCERTFVAPHRQLAVTLNALAVKLGRAEETRERAHELAVRALEAAEAALGPEHPLVATLTSNLATGYLNAGDVDAARPLAARSLDLHERRHGPEHPNTATALLSAAEIALRDGRPADARDLLDRAVAIRFSAFGLADRRTRGAVTMLANTYGRLAQVDPSVRADAMAIFGVYRGLDEAKASGGPLGFQADPATAELALRGYLGRAAERRPSEDAAVRRELDRARTSMVAADASFMAGDLDTAAVAVADAIERIERVRGTESVALVEPLHRLAALERSRSARDRAIELDRQALSILATSYGEQHPYVLAGLARLAVESAAEYGRAAARADLERVLGILGRADPDKIAGRLRVTVERSLAAIAEAPEPAPVGLSARRRAALAAPAPLVPELLADLDRVPWASLEHLGGRASDTPDDLRLLLADDAGVAGEASGRLAMSLSDAFGPSPAGAAALPYLLRIAGDGRVPVHSRGRALAVALGILRETIEAAARPAWAVDLSQNTGGEGVRGGPPRRIGAVDRQLATRSVLEREAELHAIADRLAVSASPEERGLGRWALGMVHAARRRDVRPAERLD